MHPHFSTWYRPAALGVTAETLALRSQAIETAIKKPSPDLILGLARFFLIPTTTEEDCPTTFREAIHKADGAFPLKGNVQELRILSGIALRLLMDQGDKNTASADLAALAVTCGAFARPAPVEPDHLVAAEACLRSRGSALRRRTELEDTPALPSYTKERFSPLQTLLSQNQAGPALAEPWSAFLAETVGGLTKTVSALVTASNVYARHLRIQEESAEILAWLLIAHSQETEKPFTSLKDAAPAVLAIEVADRTRLVPGPPFATMVLWQALRLSNVDPEENISIARAANGPPREWRTRRLSEAALRPVRELCPILGALQISLSTDGDEEWLPVYRKAFGISAQESFSAARIAIQVYRECLLLALGKGT